jgi:hypothetical protein
MNIPAQRQGAHKVTATFVAQETRQHLARLVAGRLSVQHDLTWLLMGREALGRPSQGRPSQEGRLPVRLFRHDPIRPLPGGRRHPAHNVGHDNLAEHGVRRPDDGDVGHLRVLAQHSLRFLLLLPAPEIRARRTSRQGAFVDGLVRRPTGSG